MPIVDSDSRYFIVSGGRGSGKSFSVNALLVMLTYEQGHTILFTRYTLTSAYISIIPEFIDKLEQFGSISDFHITKDEILNKKTGSKIIFRGIKTSSGDQTANLKSLQGITTWVVDEAEELVDESVFDKIDFSIRSQTKQNRVILILNPTTKEHWIYQRFFQNENVLAASNTIKGNVTYVHTTYKDNKKNLSQSFLQRIYEMKRKRPDKYQHQILGGWLEKAEGTIIRKWRVGDFIPTELTCYGQDFGFSADLTTLVKISIDKHARKVWVKEIYGKPHLNTSEVATRNKNECGMDLIICDNSEPRLISELKTLGLNIKPTIKKKGSILSGIALMQDYEIVVDRGSHGIIRELNNYVWKDKGEAPIDKFNHFIDAIRYGMMYLVQGVNSGVYVIR